MLNRILKKLKFVKEMEIKISQLEAVNHTLMLQKSDAIVEKNNILAELNKQEYKLKNLECALIDMIEKPHMVFAHPGSDNRYVLIDKKEMKANEEREIKFSLTFPENKVKVEVRE
jgi:hypothetical protein